MLWNQLILLEGVASIPMLLLASVYFMMIKHRHSESGRILYTCMCSLCLVLTVARQLIALRRLQLQRQICQWLGTRTISACLTVLYSICTLALCMIDQSFVAVFLVFLFAVNLLIVVESHLCLPRQWLVEQESQVQVQSQAVKKTQKYTASMGFTTCLICLDEFEEEISTVIRLPCDHIFHTDCAERWLRHNNRCPLRCTDEPADKQPDQRAPTRDGVIRV